MTTRPRSNFRLAAVAFMAALINVTTAHAQPVPAGATRPEIIVGDPTSIDGLAWLEGCWAGSVNQRDYREHWSPLRGGMMVGVSATVYQSKTQSYEYLRIESRPDGIFYVALPSGQRETSFKLTSVTTDDKDNIFAFTNPANDFPQRITYRRGTEGWLYATIDGKLKGEDTQVIFPMRRVGCESGEFIRK